jgi:hypothetical protein
MKRRRNPNKQFSFASDALDLAGLLDVASASVSLRMKGPLSITQLVDLPVTEEIHAVQARVLSCSKLALEMLKH